MLTAIENVRLFDGKKLSDKTCVYMNEGRFAQKGKPEKVIDAGGAFMMPGLIDAHCHATWKLNYRAGVKHGVTSAVSIQTPKELKKAAKGRICSSFDRALGFTEDAKAFVEREIDNGADYIKIIIEHKPMMAKTIIKESVVHDIVEQAHKRGKLVACHAVSVPSMKIAIDAGVDIHVHVPLEACMTEEMADRIAAHKATVVPTLAMMQGFANNPMYGYKKSDYENSVNCVRMLHEAGVPLLVGTDASNIIFLPWVKFGKDMHREMVLLSGAGLSSAEILAGASGLTAEAYGINELGEIAPGKYADFILIDGDPVNDINDSRKIKTVFIGGQAVINR